MEAIPPPDLRATRKLMAPNDIKQRLQTVSKSNP